MPTDEDERIACPLLVKSRDRCSALEGIIDRLEREKRSLERELLTTKRKLSDLAAVAMLDSEEMRESIALEDSTYPDEEPALDDGE